MTYQLLDSGNFWKLEQVGPYRIVRPSASAVWSPKLSKQDWNQYDAKFIRDASGDGEWEIRNKAIDNSWDISLFKLKLKMKLTSFGHLGLFPEQESNWKSMYEIIQGELAKREEVKVLNLFAYTGGSTLACACAGARVVHVDASKTSVSWAKENAELSGLSDKSIRFMVDDVNEFVAREIRRGNKYDGIILDPPSYGRGPKKQLWKVEKHQLPLIQNLKQLMSDHFLFCLLSSHSPGYTPLALENQLLELLGKGAQFHSSEMTVVDQFDRKLPSGASTLGLLNF